MQRAFSLSDVKASCNSLSLWEEQENIVMVAYWYPWNGETGQTKLCVCGGVPNDFQIP